MSREFGCATMTTMTVLALLMQPSVGHAQQTVRKDTAPKRDLSQGNTLYVVPYAHLDTQWRWSYPQVIREFIPNTMRMNFPLIEKYPNYVFNFSGSRRYEMMKEYYPADYKKVKQYIADGRWFPCGSSVDEGDANVPSAESLVRHTLYGNHYFQKEFGVSSQEFMLPDCFGFPYALPSILVHCGVKGFSTQKLTWGSAIGIPFKVGVWEGPDGNGIISALDPGAYTGEVNEDLSQNTSWLARIQNTGKQSGAFVDYHYYGAGDRGGAPNENSVEWIEKSIAGTGPIKVVSTHADNMFLSITPEQRAKLPRYKGELLLTQHSAGSITSQAYMKRWNRKNELLADAAERASVAAMWLGGMSYPSARLYNAWDLVLGSQMHDMLPGTSIPKAYEFCWNDELLALNQFAAVTQDAVGALAAQMDTRAIGTPLVVYNPLSVARVDVVEATLPTSGNKRNVQVYGPDGKPVPTQVLEQKGGTLRFLFLARVPSTGLVTFDARPIGTSIYIKTLKASKNVIENGRFRVTVNAAGDISSIYDKVNKREALKAPARMDFQYHNPSQFPAWNMDWADAQKPPRGQVSGPAKIRVVESGPVRVALEVTRETDGSKFVQTIRLSAGSAGDRVEVENTIDWQTRETALKAAFPLATGNPKATYDLQLGAIERGNNDPRKYEVPQHQWLDLSKPDGSYGVAVLNDSKFGSDKPDDDTVRLTLLYTPGVRGGYQDEATQDFGRHHILYALAPHAGDWRRGDVPWSAKRLNQPLRAFQTSAHPGSLGKTFSLLSVNNRQVEVTAVKKAEDSDEIIVRLRELSGKTAQGVQLRMAGQIVAAREVTGQEMPRGAATVRNGALVTDVPAFSLKAFAIRLAAPAAKEAPAQSQTVSLAYDSDVISTDGNRKDGAFDRAGRTLAAEQFPKTLAAGEVTFRLGATKDGAKNALTCKGQTISLPAGYDRVYLLAASDGDAHTRFTVGKQAVPVTVSDWGGYVGQWDNRSWLGEIPELTYDWHNEWGGLTPGYVKKSEIAWYASHRHNRKEGNELYSYSYLFKYGFDIPRGAKSITLPNDPHVRVFAVTVARGTHDNARSTEPLYDTLEETSAANHTPAISPASGAFNDITPVTLQAPRYWQTGALHYTLDGTTPTASSPVYTAPLRLNARTTVKAAERDANGKFGPVATATLNIQDTVAPKLAAAEALPGIPRAMVSFSEPVSKESAEQVGNYHFDKNMQVRSAVLNAQGDQVTLTLDRALGTGETVPLQITGVKDASPAGNAMTAQTVDVAAVVPVFTSGPLEPSKSQRFAVPGLPVKAKDSWTINLFCKVDQQPENRTLIAGFGRPVDGGSGTGRYWAKFAEGIQFWSAHQDVPTMVPLDLGKWQMLTATYDGTTIRLYKNGAKIAEHAAVLADDRSDVHVMPLDAWDRKRMLDGAVRDMTVWNRALPADAIQELWKTGETK